MGEGFRRQVEGVGRRIQAAGRGRWAKGSGGRFGAQSRELQVEDVKQADR